MIDPRKAALIIIDMQHGFLDSSSALCVCLLYTSPSPRD